MNVSVLLVCLSMSKHLELLCTRGLVSGCDLTNILFLLFSVLTGFSSSLRLIFHFLCSRKNWKLVFLRCGNCLCVGCWSVLHPIKPLLNINNLFFSVVPAVIFCHFWLWSRPQSNCYQLRSLLIFFHLVLFVQTCSDSKKRQQKTTLTRVCEMSSVTFWLR